MRSKAVLMTEGKISENIVKFALPIFWGSLFQQLYNVVDSLVVGNFVGKDALAAVSSSGNLIFLIVSFTSGIFVGAGVVISRYFGARMKDRLAAAVNTTVAFGIVSGLFLTVFGIAASPLILTLIKTPSNVMAQSVLYFRIYFGGAVFSTLFNTANGIFQAVGDSKHPLYYLIISSVTNVAVDLLFVAVFKWGVAGAAIATVLSQMLSMVLAFSRLSKVDDDYRVELKKVSFDLPMLSNILNAGIPAGLQNSIIAFANIIVQSKINFFGAEAMAGCGVYSKIEGFGFLPITSFAMALTTFIGQNIGAKQYDRARAGAKFGIISCVVLAELIGVLGCIIAPSIVALFNRDADVIYYGVLQSRTIMPFFCLLAFSHSISSILRGAGRPKVPMVVMLMFWCVTRVTYITIIMRIFSDIRFVFWAYPLTWALSSITFFIYYRKVDWALGYSR